MKPVTLGHLLAHVLAGAVLAIVLASAASAGPVNINTADAATLARELKGIGLKRAQAIVDYRAKHGPFKSADELGLVKGIGPAAIDKNRLDIRTGQKQASGSSGSVQRLPSQQKR